MPMPSAACGDDVVVDELPAGRHGASVTPKMVEPGVPVLPVGSFSRWISRSFRVDGLSGGTLEIGRAQAISSSSTACARHNPANGCHMDEDVHISPLATSWKLSR
jgi:hypothetical protein